MCKGKLNFKVLVSYRGQLVNLVTACVCNVLGCNIHVYTLGGHYKKNNYISGWLQDQMFTEGREHLLTLGRQVLPVDGCMLHVPSACDHEGHLAHVCSRSHLDKYQPCDNHRRY